MLGNKKLLFSYLLSLLAFRLFGLWLKPKMLTILGRHSALFLTHFWTSKNKRIGHFLLDFVLILLNGLKLKLGYLISSFCITRGYNLLLLSLNRHV